MTLLKQVAQFRGKPFHLFLKGFTIILLLCYSYIAARGEDEVLSCNVLQGLDGTIAGFVLEGASTITVKGGGNLPDVILHQLPDGTSHHRTHIPCIDKQHLAWLLLVARKEP